MNLAHLQSRHVILIWGCMPYEEIDPKLHLPDINVHAKFEENRSKSTQVSPETKRWRTDGRSNGSEGIT